MTNKKRVPTKRFRAIPNYKGIKLDTLTKKYVARKYINSKEYSKTFNNILDAHKWRLNFHPLLNETEVNHVTSETLGIKRIQTRLNGVDQRFTFAQVWELYKEQHLVTLEPQSRLEKEKSAKIFYPELMNYKMVEINAELLDLFMKEKVKQAKLKNNPRRKNFNEDLKKLKALLNWYRENYDAMFVNPVLKRHKNVGIIKPEIKRQTPKMNPSEIKMFLESFDSEKEQLWADFAEIQFFFAGRAQEPAGLQWSNVNFEKGHVWITDVAVWGGGKNKNFSRLKEVPKNGQGRKVFLNNRMMEILQRRKVDQGRPCEFFRESTGERLDFVFHIDGQPLSYRAVQYRYNKALKKAGLNKRYSSTHILRKAMANIVRYELGLDAAQAAGGWKSRDIVEKTYTDAPNELGKEAVCLVEKLVAAEQSQALSKERFPKLRLVTDR